MLVLSRRTNEEVVLPDLDVSLKVLSVRGNVVKVGIEAPREFQVFRGEVAARKKSGGGKTVTTREISRDEFHDLKNRLNAVNLCVKLFQQQREAGLDQDAEKTFQRLLRQCDALQVTLGADEVEAAGATGEGRRALLVEDDPNERELLAGLLRMSGYHVATSNDGLEALEYLRTHGSPDIVLLDMRMPRCDGRRTIETIRNEPSLADLSVFAVSASEPSEYGVSTGAGGVDRWFAKPLNPESLLQAMKRHSETTTSV